MPSTIEGASASVYLAAVTVWWTTAALTTPRDGVSRGSQPPVSRVAPQAARLTIVGRTGMASALGSTTAAAEMKAVLTALRKLVRIESEVLVVPETLT